jgi:hypothetical protein
MFIKIKKIMKTKLRLLPWLMMLILSVSALGVWAQNQDPTQTVCLGTQTYSVDAVVGDTFVWSISAGGTITSGIGTHSITINWTTAGGPYTVSVFSYKVIGCPSITQSVSVTVNPNLPASVSIAASPSGAICAGTSVTFTATPTNGGATPSYIWKKGGVAISPAETGLSYTSSTLANNDEITVEMTSNATCATGSPATSNVITMTVNPNLPASVSIAASPSGAICAGTSVTFTATPTNGGTTPSYIWKKGGVAISPAETGVSYASTTLANNDVITVEMTSNATCATGSPATSTGIIMTVNPNLPASVSIAASPSGAICAGTSVTFTATPTNGGTTPSYIWKKGGVAISPAETGVSYTSTTLANNDVITVEMTSNATCATGSLATSTGITMTVNPDLPASVSIAADQNNVCAGTSVTYTATPVNGGTAPVYAWYVNGVVQAGTGTTFSYIPINTDAVHATLTSNATCATGSPATSNTVTMIINPITTISKIWHN